MKKLIFILSVIFSATFISCTNSEKIVNDSVNDSIISVDSTFVDSVAMDSTEIDSTEINL